MTYPSEGAKTTWQDSPKMRTAPSYIIIFSIFHFHFLSASSFYNEEIAEIDEMREEVDEARKLAEEWEAKYKEMQRQMSDVESSRYKIHSLIIDNVPIQKKASATTSEFEGMYVRVPKV